MRKVCLVFWAVMLLMMPVCWAAEEISFPQVDELWEQAEAYGVERETELDQGLSGLLEQAGEQAGRLLRSSAATGAKLLAVVLLCALPGALCTEREWTGLSAVNIGGALAITALTMTDMAAMIGLGRETVGQMQSFSGVLLPAMAVLTAASGGVTAAAARQGATVLFSTLLITAMDRLVIPLVYGYVAVSCAHAAVGNPGLKKIAGLLKGTATFLLSAFLLAFVGYLTASGAVAGSVDASAIKAAKLAISRAVPVVGSVLADASETVLAGAGVLRGTVGVAGLLVVLAICLTPFLRLGIQYLIYKGTAALCAVLASPKLSQLIDAIGSAFGLVLGMTGAGALVLLVSLVSTISAAVQT